jgi:hypothetical protein
MDETERVRKHQEVRMRQLEIEEETKVRQLLKDKQDLQRDKNFEKSKKEETLERKQEF